MFQPLAAKKFHPIALTPLWISAAREKREATSAACPNRYFVIRDAAEMLQRVGNPYRPLQFN